MGPFLAHLRAIATGWRQPLAWLALGGWMAFLAWASTMWARLNAPFPEHLAAPFASQMGAVLVALIRPSDRGVWADFVVPLPSLPIRAWKRRCATTAAVLVGVAPVYGALVLLSPVRGATAAFELVLVALGAAVATRWSSGGAQGFAAICLALGLGAAAAQVWKHAPLLAGLLSCAALVVALAVPVWRPRPIFARAPRSVHVAHRPGRPGRVRLRQDWASGLGLACALSAFAVFLVSLLPSWRIDDTNSRLLLAGAGMCITVAASRPLGVAGLPDVESGRSAWTWLPVDQRRVALGLYVHGLVVATGASLVLVSVMGATAWQDVLPGLAAAAWVAAGYASFLLGRMRLGAGLILAATMACLVALFLLADPPTWLTPASFAMLTVAGAGAGWASTVLRMPR